MTSRENESASAACSGCNGPVTILYCPGPASAWNEWTTIPPRSKAATIASRISAGAPGCREEEVLQSWSSKTSVPFLSLNRVNSSSNPMRKVNSRVRASLQGVSVLCGIRSCLDDVLDDVLQDRSWTERVGDQLRFRADVYRLQPSKNYRMTGDIR